MNWAVNPTLRRRNSRTKPGLATIVGHFTAKSARAEPAPRTSLHNYQTNALGKAEAGARPLAAQWVATELPRKNDHPDDRKCYCKLALASLAAPKRPPQPSAFRAAALLWADGRAFTGAPLSVNRLHLNLTRGARLVPSSRGRNPAAIPVPSLAPTY